MVAPLVAMIRKLFNTKFHVADMHEFDTAHSCRQHGRRVFAVGPGNVGSDLRPFLQVLADAVQSMHLHECSGSLKCRSVCRSISTLASSWPMAWVT